MLKKIKSIIDCIKNDREVRHILNLISISTVFTLFFALFVSLLRSDYPKIIEAINSQRQVIVIDSIGYDIAILFCFFTLLLKLYFLVVFYTTIKIKRYSTENSTIDTLLTVLFFISAINVPISGHYINQYIIEQAQTNGFQPTSLFWDSGVKGTFFEVLVKDKSLEHDKEIHDLLRFGHRDYDNYQISFRIENLLKNREDN